jgi:glycosyltransferase involved in cell wall biosynthesis
MMAHPLDRSSRKRVLVVSYYFPPSGGPGVQRILKFVKYLPEFGFDPAVLTVAGGDYPARDESLLDEIPTGVPVLRTTIPEPYGVYRKLTRKQKGSAVDVNVNRPRGQRVPTAERLAEWVRGMAFVPDARVGWLLTGRRPGIEFARRIGAQVVFSSSPPYTCALLGRAVARGAGIPWVPELRDPWTEFLSAPKRPEPARTLDRRLERGIYHDAPRLVVAWSGIEADLRAKFPEENPAKFRLIPNGYDPEDMTGVSPVRNERFTVLYTGSLYGVRNPETFLAAVGQLLAQGDLDPDRVRIRFIGRFGEDVRAMFRRADVAGVVEERGYVPHAESVAELLGAHALLLVVDDVPGSEHIVPGKVFEYLGARRPILAVGPEGDVATLVRSIRAGSVLARADVDGIAGAVLALYREWLAGGNTVFRGDPGLVEGLSRRERTRDLARVLDEVVEEPHVA